jgi:hypothetical protein
MLQYINNNSPLSEAAEQKSGRDERNRHIGPEVEPSICEDDLNN